MILILLFGAIIGVGGIGALVVGLAFVLITAASSYSKRPDSDSWLKALMWVVVCMAVVAGIVVGIWSMKTVVGILHSLNGLKTVH